MAITTLDGAIAGMKAPREFFKVTTPTLVAGRPHSLWYLAGIPSAGAAPSSGIGGGTHSATVTGQMPFSNPVSGNTYLARIQGAASIAGTLMLCDRLWSNSGLDVTSTSEQTFTGSAQIPARDINGTNAGDGVFAAVEVSAATGAGTPTLTLKYTNSAGTANQTATNIIPTVATSAQGAFYPIGLASGDNGIQKAQSLQLNTTWTSGTIHVVLYRVIARLELTSALVPQAIDALTSGFPQMFNDSVPFWVFIPSTTTASVVQGNMVVTQG